MREGNPKRSAALGESCDKCFSDGGSIPPGSKSFSPHQWFVIVPAVLYPCHKSAINLPFFFAFCLVIRVADNQKAEEVLTDAGFHMISDADVAKL